MKRLLLPVLCILMSCGVSTKTDNSVVLSDLDTDFPVTDTISLSLRQTFEIFSKIMNCKTKDSILYVAEDGIENCGHCYNINTGEQISTIVTRGKANHEMLNLVDLLMVGDSVQLLDAAMRNRTPRVSIKTFAHKDFLTKGMGERDYSTVILPDSLFTSSRIKTLEGEVFGTIPKIRDLYNNFCYFVYGDNGVTYFGEVLKELVEMNVELSEKNIRLFNTIFEDKLFAYHNGRIAAANGQGFMLEIINTTEKRIERGKYYNRYILKETSVSAISNYRTLSIGCTQNNIFCHIVERSKENDESVHKNFIFIFDWELNPIKKIYFGNILSGDQFWFSSDCKTICRMNMNTEKQELFEGKIVL